MFLGEHYDGVGHDADHDGRHAVENVCGEANDIAETIASEFREVDASAHAYGNSDNAGEREDERGADDGIGHSPARLAHRFWSLSEEGPVQRAHSAVDQIGE